MDTTNLVYNDLVRERDRLRDARRGITAQLGPLPAASAIIVGLFGALSKDINKPGPKWLYGLAVAIFVVMVFLSSIAIQYRPYRTLRDEVLDDAGQQALDGRSEPQWLETMIDVERKLKNPMKEAFEMERRFLLWVQWLLVGQVLLLASIPLFF